VSSVKLVLILYQSEHILLSYNTLISGAFIAEGVSKGENPKILVIEKVLNAPLKQSFTLFSSYEVAIKKLQEQKIEIADAQSIDAIAKANKTSPFKIVGIISKKLN